MRLPDVNRVEQITTDGGASSKKVFVEPEVSSPVNVLEATTFFQFSDSGVLNP